MASVETRGRRSPSHRVRRATSRSSRRARHRRGLGAPARCLVTATASSSLGDGLALVAFPLLALRYTHNPLLVAGVAFADTIPALLFGLPAGVLADRWPRRTMARAAEWIRLGVLAAFVALIVLGLDSLWSLYATVFLIASFEQVYKAAAFSSLPGIVPSDLLGRANSRLWVADTSGEQFIGQGLGGLALGASRALPFAVDAVSFAASAVLVGRALPPDEPVRPDAPGRKERNLRAELGEGLRWFASHPVLRLLAALIGSFALCQFIVAAIVVLYARRVLHLSNAEYGLLMAVAAIGSVLGSLAADRVAERLGAVPSTVLGGVLTAGAYLGLAAWRSPVGLVVFLMLESLAVPVASVASLTLRQRLIPSELLGRVGMVFRLFLYAAMPLGALIGGLLAAHLPYREVFLVAGALQLTLLLALSSRLIPRARADQQIIELEGRSGRPADASGEAAVIELDPVIDLGAGDGAPVTSGDRPEVTRRD